MTVPTNPILTRVKLLEEDESLPLSSSAAAELLASPGASVGAVAGALLGEGDEATSSLGASAAALSSSLDGDSAAGVSKELSSCFGGKAVWAPGAGHGL